MYASGATAGIAEGQGIAGVGMSEADRKKWEARYARPQAAEASSVDPFLEEIENDLPRPGRALDLAGGTGRHALFLARRGWTVTLVDISDRGLSLAQRAAKKGGLALVTLTLDLEEDPLPEGPFDLVVCTWFLLSGRNWIDIASVLAPGGTVVYVQPTPTHLQRHAHPGRRFTVEFSDLEAAVRAAGIVSLRLEQGWDRGGNHTARLLGRLPLEPPGSSTGDGLG